MSIIISCETAESVVVITDGAVYDKYNRLTDVRRKIAFSYDAPVAIATRGNRLLGERVSEWIMESVEAHGFDVAMRALEEVMTEFSALPADRDGIEVLIAGISQSMGPRHLFFRTVELNDDQGKLKLIHPPQLYIGAGSDGRDDSLAAMNIPKPYPSEKPDAYFAKFGPRILQFYRECPVPPSRWDELQEASHIVGGQCDMTVVSAAGVTCRTIHRWNDKIGDIIDPFTDHKTVVSLPASLNRQQRRSAERMMKKRA